MNILIKLATFSLVTAAAALAQTTSQAGTWSVYSPAGNVANKNVVMLQTRAQEQRVDARGDAVSATLDIICKNNKIVAIAIENGSKLDRHVIGYSQAVPTTKMIFAVAGETSLSENWAVADGGLTLAPYSELFQARLNQTWVKRISGTDKMVAQVAQKGGDPISLTFATDGLATALQSAGCSE